MALRRRAEVSEAAAIDDFGRAYRQPHLYLARLSPSHHARERHARAFEFQKRSSITIGTTISALRSRHSSRLSPLGLPRFADI